MPQNLLLLSALIAGLGYFPFTTRPPSVLKSAIKTVPLLALALISILAGGPGLLSAGLLLSAAGDLALSRPGRRAFLYGLSCFALAHLLYMLVFTALSGQALWAAFASAPALALAMLALALSTELWLAPHTGALRWPVRAYVALIGLMMLAALNLGPTYRLASLGAAAFVLSDLALSIRKFRRPGAKDPLLSWAIWGLYLAGQGLILWGVLAP